MDFVMWAMFSTSVPIIDSATNLVHMQISYSWVFSITTTILMKMMHFQNTSYHFKCDATQEVQW